MKIFHLGSCSSPQAVDGVNYTIWSVAEEQAILGHQISIVIDTKPEKSHLAFANKIGVKLIYLPANTWGYNSALLDKLFNSESPDLVHMHSVFLPKQASFAKKLDRKNIPYVITPNAMSPQLLQRGKLKKSFYSWLVEKPRFLKASAITIVTPREEIAVRNFVPGYKGIVSWIPNPVNPEQLTTLTWTGTTEPKRIVYLGRFDVLHKGIDILVEIARYLPPEIEVHLYGTEDARTNRWMQSLKSNLPSNIYFHAPVFGSEKAKVLSEASLYIQTSRWEVFGISIAEAMYMGVPCAIADTLNLAELFNKHDLGLVFSPNPQQAANCIKDIIINPDRLHSWSQRGQFYAKEHFLPKKVALDYLSVYQKVLAQS